MSSLASLVQDVEGAIASGDSTKRVESLRRVTELFVAHSTQLGETHVAIFDEVILRLARDIEFKARVELSETLADITNAPQQVVRDLAFDNDIDVAAPVIERSERLDEDTLVAIAQERGQSHLMALTKRPTLSERVTDVIVDRGDETVIRSVARNDGARFSHNGFSQLMDKARQDETLQASLRSRRDIPPQHLTTLIEIAREKARETLSDEFGTNADKAIDKALSGALAPLMNPSSASLVMDDFRSAQERVLLKEKNGGLFEDDVAKWVKEGQVEDALAAIAHLAHVPVEVAAQAYHAPQYDPLLFLVRAIKFSWPTFKLLLIHKAGRNPPQELLKSAFNSFQLLSVQTAQRVIRFVSARGKATQHRAA